MGGKGVEGEGEKRKKKFWTLHATWWKGGRGAGLAESLWGLYPPPSISSSRFACAGMPWYDRSIGSPARAGASSSVKHLVQVNYTNSLTRRIIVTLHSSATSATTVQLFVRWPVHRPFFEISPRDLYIQDISVCKLSASVWSAFFQSFMKSHLSEWL